MMSRRDLSRMAVLALAVTIFVFLGLACQKTEKRTKAPQWNSPAEEAFEATLPPPSELEWRSLSERMVKRQTDLRIQERVGSGSTVELDFWKTHGKWFAAVLSAQSDSILVYRLVIGRYRASGNDLEYYYVGQPTLPVVTGEARSTYLEYSRNGELWRLFDAGRFWEDESSWIELYNRTGLIVDAGDTYRPIHWTGVNDILPYRASGRKTVPSERNSWSLQVGFLVAQNGVVTGDTALERIYPTCGVDFLVFYDYWFGAIVSRYNDSGVIYRSIVGQHLADSILYRYLDDSATALKEDEMRDYRRLAEHDSLWSLVESYSKWQDRPALEQLWSESESRSTATPTELTRVMRLGLPPSP